MLTQSLSLTSVSSGLSMALSCFRTNNQSALFGSMAFTQNASIAPRFSSPGDRHTRRVIRALHRLGSFGDRPRITCFSDSDRSEPNAFHLNPPSVCSFSAARVCSASWPPAAGMHAHWQECFVLLGALVSWVPSEHKAGMVSETMGVRRDGAGEEGLGQASGKKALSRTGAI
jgi:hypothetical protein